MGALEIPEEINIIMNDFQSEIENAAEEAIKNAIDFNRITFSFSCAQRLFHYCSLETFYSIIESNCFWLSHPKFMNDISEYKNSIRVIKNFFEEYNKTITEDDNSKDFFEKIIKSVDRYEKEFKGFDENKYEVQYFFTCFTSDGDNLPMWSIYRGKNIGLSIELDFSDKDYFVKVPGRNDEVSPFLSNAILTDIEYEENKTKETINIFLNHIKNYYNKNNFNRYTKVVNELASDAIVLYLINMSSYLKNSNFSYEQETRLVLRIYDPKDIKFRVRDKFIVPYIEFPLEEKIVDSEDETKISKKKKFDKCIIPIKSITISPYTEEPELVKASIEAFLNHKGYNIDKIKINQSTIPFKPR